MTTIQYICPTGSQSYFKGSRRGKNKNLTALKSNSNTVWFNFQTHIYIYIYTVWFGFIMFNAILNNISVISWRSVLLVEETGGPGENHRPAACH